MLFNKEIEDLRDDGFEGSNDEQHIFKEVFFGKGIGGTSKRCLVTGVINFECESTKNSNTSLSSNSENSALTIQPYVEPCKVNEEVRWIPERPALPERNEVDASVKRLKPSADELSTKEPDALKVLTQSAIHLETDCVVSCPDTVSVGQRLMFHLAESSCQGVISSCYLFKKNVEMDRGGDVGDFDVSKLRLPNVDGNDGKKVGLSIAIASPVSQESFATRDLVLIPSVNVADKLGSPLRVEERPKDIVSSGCSSKLKSSENPRIRLQEHIVRLLTAAGWCIDRRKRPSRSYVESVYRSPEGRSIWELSKAWRLCGQSLFANRHNIVLEDDGKEWADLSQFWSDLSDTLLSIEKEINQSDASMVLAHNWSLLDPFVTVIYVERKIGILRKGDVVKATQRLRIDNNQTNGLALTLKNEDEVGSKFEGRQMSARFLDSSVASESAMTVSEENYHACGEQFGNRSFSDYCGQKSETAPKFLTDVSIDKANNGGDRCLGYISNEMRIQFGENSRDRISSQDLTSLPARGLHSNYVQSVSSLHDVLVTLENCDDAQERMETICLHQDRNTESPRFDKQNFAYELNVETLKEYVEDPSMGFWEEKNGVLGGQIPGKMKISTSPDFLISEVVQDFKHGEEGRLCIEASKFSAIDVTSKRKICRKSKKISEIKLTTLYRKDTSSSNMAEKQNIDTPLELKDFRENLELNTNGKGRRRKSSSSESYQHPIEKREPKFKKTCFDKNSATCVQKTCPIKDDDLLISAIIKNKAFSPNKAQSFCKEKFSKPRAWSKLKDQKDGRKLLPRSLGRHCVRGKGSYVGLRTVLAWLIDAGVISLKDSVQYRNLKDNTMVKDGIVNRDGILCKCCSKLLSVSEFKVHAGFKLNRPCMNLFLESGKPFTLCLLQAWSAEYKIRKNGVVTVKLNEGDKNDELCGRCGDAGDLICCDNCPSTFHKECLSMQKVPEGNWYCTSCTCWICGVLVDDKDPSSFADSLKCSQCEHKYHAACLKEKIIHGCVASDTRFCGGSCQEVYLGIHSRIGLINHTSDGFSWSLLRCFHDDQKVHSAQRFALQAECNSKLAVAVTIMEECFKGMVDPITRINMIPHVIYNWGLDLARLNFHGFFTMVLEKDDVLISVASLRVHGAKLAEMPLIATCSKYRRQGMCRRLMTAIEELLTLIKVETLVVAAIPESADTWINGFGFKYVEDDEKESLNKINLTVLPGTELLKKILYQNKKEDGDLRPFDTSSSQKNNANSCTNKVVARSETDLGEAKDITDSDKGRADILLVGTDESTKVGAYLEGVPINNSQEHGIKLQTEIEQTEEEDLQPSEEDPEMQIFKEASASTVGGRYRRLISGVEATGVYDETNLSLNC